MPKQNRAIYCRLNCVINASTWISLAVGAYGAAVSTVVAAIQIAHRRRKVFFIVKVDHCNIKEDGTTSTSAKDLAASFGVLRATVVNIGVRPVDIHAIGMVVRPRGKRIYWDRRTDTEGAARIVRNLPRPHLTKSLRLKVPAAPETNSTELPRLLSDGEAATVGWSLIKAPFKSHEPRGIFAVDVTGKSYKFRIPRRVVAEVNRQVGVVQRPTGPLFAGAIAETAPEKVEEGLWAIVGDTLFFLDEEEKAIQRLKFAASFPYLKEKLEENGRDLSEPVEVQIEINAPGLDAQQVTAAFKGTRETSDFSMHLAKADADGQPLVYMTGKIAFTEPVVAAVVDTAAEVAAMSDNGSARLRVGSCKPPAETGPPEPQGASS